MRKSYLSFLLLLFPLIGYSQDIDQNVIGVSGDYSENGTASLSWTIGEIVVATVSDGTNTLTQGFQQGNFSVTTLIKQPEASNYLKVYPNPVKNILNVETDTTGLDFQLLNINGQAVKIGKIESQSETIDFSNLTTGTYFLKINNKETHKIVKH